VRRTVAIGQSPPGKQGELGVALLLAMFALAILGGLAAAAFLVAGQQRLLGRNMLRQTQAFTVAETAAEEVALEWSGGWYADLPVAGQATASGAGYSGWYRRTVVRLSPTSFMVKAEGFSPDWTSRQHVGLLLTSQQLPVTIGAAFTTRGPVALGAGTVIDGADSAPGAWTDCPVPGPPLPAVRSPSPEEISYVGCDSGDCLRGMPPVLVDPTLAGTPFPIAGDLPFDSLRALADRRLPGGDLRVEPTTTGGLCNTADAYNWGDPESPAGPCGRHFPVVWIEGDVVIYGDRGQGVLLVNGNLTLRGGFSYFGPVLVAGTLETDGAGGRVVGGVVAANQTLGRSAFLGGGGITYSSCAISRVLAQSARVRPLSSRGWVGLY